MQASVRRRCLQLALPALHQEAPLLERLCSLLPFRGAKKQANEVRVVLACVLACVLARAGAAGNQSRVRAWPAGRRSAPARLSTWATGS